MGKSWLKASGLSIVNDHFSTWSTEIVIVIEAITIAMPGAFHLLWVVDWSKWMNG